MVRVRRPVIADNTLELPAGGVQKNETLIEAACRELAEETGIKINDLNRYNAQAPMVLTTRSPVLSHIYQVKITQKEFDERTNHDDEVVSVERFSFNEALEKIEKNEIYVGLHIAILTRYLLQNQHIIPAGSHI